MTLRPRVVGGTLLCLLALLPASSAQGLPRFVNCGDLNGFPTGEPGYELLSESAAPPGITLSPAPLDTVHVAGNQLNFYGELPLEPDFIAVDPDQHHRTHRMTSLWLADGSVLTLDGLAPSTTHRLKLELGALAPWSELFDFFNPPYWSYLPSISREVRVELPDGQGGWRTYASDLRCTSAHKGSNFETYIGGIVDLWVLADADASGRIELRLWTDNTDPLFLSGFEIHAHEPLPIVYQRSGGEALLALSPNVQTFVDAFNQHDFALAEDLARALPDAFERGVALMHLAGWLDGSRDGLVRLLGPARQALVQAGPAHPATARLLDEIDHFERALLHLAASGRTLGHTCPEDGGYGFLTEDCGGSLNIDDLTRTNANAQVALRELSGLIAQVDGPTVLHDLVDWNAGTLDATEWEPSPLVFAAARLTASTMVAMNPQWSGGGGVDGQAFRDLRDGLINGFIDLGFAATDFPRDLELPLLDLYVDQGQLPVNWPLNSYENLFTPQQIADSWWGDAVDVPADLPSIPPWANTLRQQRILLRALAHYWLVDRLDGGEFGGGLGDDVELLAQFGKLYVGRQGPVDRRSLDGLDTMVRWTIEGSGDVVDGYFQGLMTDVEHSAEYTTNTWSALISGHGHVASAAEIALGATRHLRDTAEPATAFAGLNNLGRLHFKSYFFTVDGPSTVPGQAYDTLLDGRAMVPGWGTLSLGLLDEFHPLSADLTAWADAWRHDALDPSVPGKPLGWYGPAAWPTGAAGNAGWWTHTSDPADVKELVQGVHSYTLDLLLAAYERSSAPDRWRYLLPAVRMFRSVMAWEDAGFPAGQPAGSSHWAALWFKSSFRFGPIVAALHGALEGDVDLNTLSDPQNPGTTYVDAALTARMRTWLHDEFNGQVPATRYIFQPIQECTGGFTAKSTLQFTGGYANVVPYYRVLFPLLTTHVIHTDRIGLGGGLSNLAVAETGANLIEGIVHRPLVRWRQRDQVEQDFVVQCNYRDAQGTIFTAFVYSFEPVPITTTLQLDVGLQPGHYDIEVGAGEITCDQFQPGTPTTHYGVEKRGLTSELEIVLDPGLNIVRVVRGGPAAGPAASYDLAVDTPHLAYEPGRDGPELVFSARVANAASAPSPPTTLELYVATMDGDGLLESGEVLLGSLPVPSLAGASGWSLDQRSLEVRVPLSAPYRVTASSAGGRGPSSGVGAGGPVGSGPGGPGSVASGGPVVSAVDTWASALLSGQGVRLRARVLGGSDESDPLNNEALRGWTHDEVVFASDW